MSISAPEAAAAATSSAPGSNAIAYRSVAPAAQQSDLATIAQHMFALMLRNVASDGFVFADPANPGGFSRPGCVIASPSYPEDLSVVNQNYVFNWTRDAAVTAIELVAATMPTAQPLIDYVNFAAVCQSSGAPTVARASYTIEGNPRQWSDQSDGPALQTLAILKAYPLLDAASQAVAQAVIAKDLAYLLGAYQGSTVNLWEEQTGASFFARAVQLRCFQQIEANTLGIPVPPGTGAAITWLQGALQDHWDGNIYQSILPAPPGYDPNSDVVIAAVYGAVPFTDTKLLATAAQLRSLWADPTSPFVLPDQRRRPAAGPRTDARPLPRRLLRRRYARPRRRRPSLGAVQLSSGRGLLPTGECDRGSADDPARLAVRAVLRSDRRRSPRRRPRPPSPRCRPRAIKYCRRSCSTAITSNSVNSSMEAPDLRKASGT